MDCSLKFAIILIPHTCNYNLLRLYSVTLLVEMVPEPTVHLQSNYYTVSEDSGSLEVCAEVTSDQFDGNFQANYATSEGSAEGLCIFVTYHNIIYQICT